jgi:transposase
VDTTKALKRRRLPQFLTDSQVDEVRARVAAGESQAEVARAFRVHYSTVSRIVNALRRVDPFEGDAA